MKRLMMAILATVLVVSVSQAGRTGVSDLRVDALRIEFSAGGVPTGTVVNDPADVIVTLPINETARNNATLNSVGPTVLAASIDGLPAHTGGPAPANNDFTTPFAGAGVRYARADSLVGGAIFDGLAAADPRSQRTYADLVLDDPFAALAAADSEVTSSADFVVNNGFTGQIVVDGLLTRSVSGGPLPPGAFELTNAFGVAILGTGITVGGVQTNSFVFSPALLNASGALPAPVPFVGLASTPFTLAPGVYSVIATQGSQVEFDGVPEPGMLAIFVVVLSCVAVGARRRKAEALS